MQAWRYAIPLSLAGALALLSACGPATRLVSFRITDPSTNAPLAHARLRGTPLSTNGMPLPVSLEYLREASESLKVSTSADEHGMATLRLYKGKPSMIEVLRWDLLAPKEAPATEWIYDPHERTLTPVGAMRLDRQAVKSISLELAGP